MTHPGGVAKLRRRLHKHHALDQQPLRLMYASASRSPRSAAVVSLNRCGSLRYRKAQSSDAIRAAAAAGVARHRRKLPRLRRCRKSTRSRDLALCWHFIGAIQSNKTRDIARYFQWVQTLDRAEDRTAPVGSARLGCGAARRADSDQHRRTSRRRRVSPRMLWQNSRRC